MSGLLNFDLTPVEEAVTISGKPYTLREATGDAACQYRNAALAGTELVNGKPSRFRNLADVEPLLVSLCLFDSETGVRVPLHVVRSWPTRVVNPLFERAKEISGLAEREDKEGTKEANPTLESPNGMGDGSD